MRLGNDCFSQTTPAAGPVAVLGFENLGDPADADQLSRMLAGLITTGLGDSAGIQLVSSAKVRTSLKEAGATDGGFDPTLAANAAQIAGAGLMVVGQVMQNAEMLLLTAELVDVASGLRRTYAELNARCNRCANAMVDGGLASGDRVATLLMNGPEFVETFFGAAKVGGVVVGRVPLPGDMADVVPPLPGETPTNCVPTVYGVPALRSFPARGASGAPS